jgi:hypothetical protein
MKDCTTGYINTAASGIAYVGRCGVKRQETISKLSKGEVVAIVREPDNPHDPDAAMLVRADGNDFGWLPAGMLANISDDGGTIVSARVAKVEPLPESDLIGVHVALTVKYRRKKRQPKSAEVRAAAQQWLQQREARLK